MDEVDKKLVMLLQSDGRKTLQELSEVLGKPKTTVATRIKKLENEGVILGYKAVVNPFSLGYRLLAFVLISVKRGVAAKEAKPLQQEVAEKIITECDGQKEAFRL